MSILLQQHILNINKMHNLNLESEAPNRMQPVLIALLF